MICRQCPRECNIERHGDHYGFCASPNEFLIARAGPHAWEEPPISGTRGSGTVFFGGCNLRCVFCQNRAISHGGVGRKMSDDALLDTMLRLQDAGVHNINLVTPSHYTLQLARVLERARPLLHIPVVWNSSGYESADTLRLLAGLVDIYLPDLKYHSPLLAEQYSGAKDYPEVAKAALAEMYRQVGAAEFDGEGMLKKGVVVRHLVLPSHRADSLAVLDDLAATLPVPAIRLSLMRQYTPDFAPDSAPKHLKRRLTSFEYDTVVKKAIALGFDGFLQESEAADKKFTPDF